MRGAIPPVPHTSVWRNVQIIKTESILYSFTTDHDSSDVTVRSTLQSVNTEMTMAQGIEKGEKGSGRGLIRCIIPVFAFKD